MHDLPIVAFHRKAYVPHQRQLSEKAQDTPHIWWYGPLAKGVRKQAVASKNTHYGAVCQPSKVSRLGKSAESLDRPNICLLARNPVHRSFAAAANLANAGS
jgi:hypothetical protein